ncbi:hypothetical protein SEA_EXPLOSIONERVOSA_32 [Mycobacterium phage ExplosioNervosa]|uniref:Minor tail protein n=4 Tax=Fromanvirus alma TaxID=1089111 RepID=A0A142K4U0_9CAUD|nr:minor tail protein [Mycobacterium phage Alma]AMS00832.1 minor tail protein [Mycobacterium phage Eidsmoe]AOT26151.1 hypothetical protein SEA_QOBBIT_32 [Mycobacterium phage Qobbit]AVI03741.1 minor tail protein [Mycobacterium phage Conquerage]AXC35043.1 minor tail protein [Mycobacterium phage Priya]AZF93511.1 hypothetical protein SEA_EXPLOSIONERVOSA_32 [Mycobacterium phage ExplosioNervosa]
MQGLFNPDSNWEVFMLCFVAACPVLAVVLPVWLTQRAHGKKLGDIKEQVANSHSTNLRDDIDRVLASVATLAEGLGDVKTDVRDARTDIADVRRDLRLEREERINGDRLRIEAQSINISPGG